MDFGAGWFGVDSGANCFDADCVCGVSWVAFGLKFV